MHRLFGMDEDTITVRLPAWAGVLWSFVSLRVAAEFVVAWGDFMRGPFGPPRPPLPGADSALGFALLTLAVAYLPFLVPAGLLRYTRWRDEDDALFAWAAAGRLALVPAYVATLGLLAYTLLRLRHV